MEISGFFHLKVNPVVLLSIMSSYLSEAQSAFIPEFVGIRISLVFEYELGSPGLPVSLRTVLLRVNPVLIQADPGLRGAYAAGNSLFLPPQPSDFSVSLKASGRNKHFKVQLVDSVYCIGQRRFHSMDELVEHYKKAPIFTSEHGEKLYLVRALQ